MDIGDAGIGEDRLGLFHHARLLYHYAGAIDDAIFCIVALDQIIGGALQHLGHLLPVMAGAFVGAQKDRAEFGIGLRRGKGPVGEDQHLRALGDVAQAMAAGVATAVGNAALGCLAVGVWSSRLQSAGGVAGKGGNFQHMSLLSFSVPLTAEKEAVATRILRI